MKKFTRDELSEMGFEQYEQLSELFRDILDKHNISLYHPDNVSWNETRVYAVAEDWRGVDDAEAEILASGIVEQSEDSTRSGSIIELFAELVFSDEYSSCSGCGKLVKTSPSYYGDLPDYLYTDCELLCCECLTDDILIDECLNRDDRALNGNQIKAPIESHGFILCNDDEYENGFHPGQNDNPVKILAEAQQTWPDCDFVFLIPSAGQFDVMFNLYRRER